MCISHPGGGLEGGIYTCIYFGLCTHISYALIEEQTLDVILLFMIVDFIVQKGCKTAVIKQMDRTFQL